MAPLVATIMAIASPYLAKGAEEFAKAAGTAAFGAAKALMERLHQWWTKEPVANAAAEAFSSDPQRYAKILGEQLDYDLSKDDSLAADLQKLVDAAGPYVDVIQKIDVAAGDRCRYRAAG